MDRANLDRILTDSCKFSAEEILDVQSFNFAFSGIVLECRFLVLNTWKFLVKIFQQLSDSPKFWGRAVASPTPPWPHWLYDEWITVHGSAAGVMDDELKQAEDKFTESKQLAEIAMQNLLENDVSTTTVASFPFIIIIRARSFQRKILPNSAGQFAKFHGLPL